MAWRSILKMETVRDGRHLRERERERDIYTWYLYKKNGKYTENQKQISVKRTRIAAR